MSPIITLPGRNSHEIKDVTGASLDVSARGRADKLARATVGEMGAALALLSMLDPEAFEIGFTAVPLSSGDGDDEEPIPVCRICGALIGIFPDSGLHWQHLRGDGITSGTQEVYEPGHAPEVTWILPDEDPDDL